MWTVRLSSLLCLVSAERVMKTYFVSCCVPRRCPAGMNGTSTTADGCVDINECEISNGGCDPVALCINTVVGYTCGLCPSGYKGSGFIGCSDVNECASDNGGCSSLRTECVNTIPGFECGECL